VHRPHRLPILLACAAGACALSAPAALAGHGAPADGKGVVLSRSAHGIRIVDRGHRVSDAHVVSTRGLRRGDVVTVRDGRARVGDHLRKVSFLARVARSSGRGAVLTLGDGSTFKVSAAKPHGRRARSAGVTIDFQGLAPGQALLVTIATDAQGNVVLTIKLLPGATQVGDGDELHATGVVTDDEGEGSFGIAADDGSGLRFGDPQRLLEAADAGWCDVVEVAYHADGRRLVADALRVTGQSDDGDCAGEEGFDEVDGTVTALAADRSSLTLAPDDGAAAAAIPVEDPSLLDGIEVGDDVAVTLDEDGTAIDVELLDWVDDPGDGGDE
jgi:hypothetical protein